LKRDSIKYDLHIHTVLSDGTFTYREIIDKAVETGLKGISITDHDVISADISGVYDYARSIGLLFVHGIEFSTKTNNVHIIGYNLDLDNADLCLYLKEEQQKRLEALKEMCLRAAKEGFNVTFEEILAEQSGGPSSLGRPHLARAMEKKGYVTSLYEAFQKWLKKGQPIYADYVKFHHSEIISRILKWGGVPVLAHLSLVNPELQEKVFDEALESGLMGLEAYYPRFNSSQTQKLLIMAKKHKLIVTGGSDFHGVNKPDIELGSSGLTEESFEKSRETLGV
jgi:3',5'-nucleoside bisphosphate phosphatase